ncbi:MAG TPA: DNA repair protein RecN [Gemmatimonadales bacterium]|nr:DNA repair protein RecN [Gemmatimonadales bacterium]
MIVELRVRDLATIADVALQCGPGLNVLTGETGAGKSMLIDALALLLGERADSALVRPGAARCVVEGAFDTDPAFRRRLDALGLDAEEDRVVIRREVSAEGRSRAWVNGSPTTLTILAELGAALVDLHGQHETQSLLRPDAQRDILDAYAGAGAARAGVEAAWREVQALRDQEAGLARQRDEVKRRADYLRHVVTEIRDARLKPGEDEQLEAEARKLSHAGTLGEQARRLAEAIDGEDAGALTALGHAERAMAQLERQDPDTAKWRELLDGAYANLTELARLATEYADGISDDPKRQAAVEARRDLIFKLTQKHGATLEAVIATGEQAAKELDLLDTADTDLRALAARRAAAEESLQRAAATLTEKRTEASGRLGRAVGKLLPKLGLPGGKLEVEMTPLAEPEAHGAEQVVFTVRLNQGHDARPLARTASGGELSRLMLALKVVLAGHDDVPTLIFDEVDTGIGGEVGTQVGEALAQVAAKRQVLVVTHLPQIAAVADRHLVVSKAAKGGIATSDVQQIHGEDRITELARMLGDADAATARKHAEVLLAVRR